MGGEEGRRGPPQAFRLSRAERLERRVCPGARLDLAEREDATPLGGDVDLAAPASPAPRDDPPTPPAQVTGCDALALEPDVVHGPIVPGAGARVSTQVCRDHAGGVTKA